MGGGQDRLPRYLFFFFFYFIKVPLSSRKEKIDFLLYFLFFPSEIGKLRSNMYCAEVLLSVIFGRITQERELFQIELLPHA